MKSIRFWVYIDGIFTHARPAGSHAAGRASPHLMAQTAGTRTAVPQRHHWGDIAPEMARAAHLRQRPAVVGRLRDSGNPADPQPRRARIPALRAVDRLWLGG